MKNWLLLIGTFICFAIYGCSKEEASSDNPQAQDEPRYYVKYEVYMPLGSGFESSTTRKITFVSENGEQSLSTTKSSWEATYGPLKKGTELYLGVAAESGGIRNDVEYYVRLSVSRNKEPFVLKGEDRGISVSSLYTSYKIDF